MGSFGRLMACAALAALAAGCADRTGRALAEKDNSIGKLKGTVTELNEDIKERDETIAALARKEQEMQELIDKLNRQLAQSQQKTSEAARPVSSKEVSEDGMQVGLTKEGFIKITVADRVLFESGEAKLRDSSHRVLAAVSKVLKDKYPANVVRVEGHTDSDPIKQSKWRDNMDLSLARARAVYDHLVKSGLDAGRMYVSGYGEHQPVAPNTTAANKAKNRRVEIVIMPKDVKVVKEDVKVSSRK
ncbi:MAG: OmpA family protein [Planctomycetota bacterium]|nr:OmpA family protein [Planctomycetota bacterium]